MRLDAASLGSVPSTRSGPADPPRTKTPANSEKPPRNYQNPRKCPLSAYFKKKIAITLPNCARQAYFKGHHPNLTAPFDPPNCRAVSHYREMTYRQDPRHSGRDRPRRATGGRPPRNGRATAPAATLAIDPLLTCD